MDPFNMPAWGAGQAKSPIQQVTSTVAQVAPLARTYSGTQVGQANVEFAPQPVASTPQSGNLAKFAHWVGGAFHETGSIVEGAAKWLGKNVANMAVAPVKFGNAEAHGILDNLDISSINAQNQQNSDRLVTLHNLYKSGKINTQQYQAGLKDLSTSINALEQQQSGLQNRIKADQSTTISSGIDTAVTLLSIGYAGFGKGVTTALTADGAIPLTTQTAGKYIASSAANMYFKPVVDAIAKVASDSGVFAKLEPAAQAALQKATAEVVTQAGSRMTAAQIGRATAANLALKYPIYFNMLSSTGQQIYHELDQAKYGDAVRTLAFNAALLLSGGPIGQALKYGSKGIGAVTARTFGRTAFIDELSKGIGDGSVNGIYEAINKLPKSDQPFAVKVMSNLEATNLAAVTGKDATAAAWRVLNGMESYEGLSMSQFTHKEALNNMLNFAKAQQLADETAKALGLGPITVGRVDARALGGIAKSLTGFDAKAIKAMDKAAKSISNEDIGTGTFTREQVSQFAAQNKMGVEDARQEMVLQKFLAEEKGQAYRPVKTGASLESPENKQLLLNLWDNEKAMNPKQAWAVNENFDNQIKALINKHENTIDLSRAIQSIKAQFVIKGFPEAEAKQLSRMGYIPIKPLNLEAPFKEGTGKLATAFSANDDLFIHAVQPLPVLGSVGSLLTHMGMSPTASTSRVYQVFNKNLSENIIQSDTLKFIGDKGATKEDTADMLIKKLSNYAHNPTRGVSVNGRPLAPITDLRQLTTKDVMEALSVEKGQAQEVKGAIMDAMIQVPITVRGLGDKLVDLAYKFPTTGRYLRIQGAARFSWNPFFQAKLAYKTELLAQAEARGKFPTLGGTNSMLAVIFPDKYKQIDGVRKLLRENGIFDEKAVFGEGLSGEAVNDVGVAGANLTHKLIPSQERSIASLVATQADRVGLTTEQFVQRFPTAVRDTVQMIAQYDRNSVFLHSAMARTLNLAFFPFRFEYKVASIMARSLAKTSTMTQLAVIKGLYNAHDWLNSPEGQAWYSTNSDAIKLFEYFTPVQTLSEVSHILGISKDSIGSFGELGGLPFGWIPQLLDAEGLTHFSQPYVNPKTGETLPDYVPVTDKGRAAAAIQDFVGSLFSYPGATAGLPSKTSITLNAALGATGASKKNDFLKTSPGALTDQQQSFAQTVQRLSGQSFAQNSPPGLPPTPPTAPTQVTPQPSPLTTPLTKPSRAGSTTSKKKKKSEFTPALLPGQSSLGQL